MATQPGDALVDVVVEYIDANEPVAPTVEGRVVENQLRVIERTAPRRGRSPDG